MKTIIERLNALNTMWDEASSQRKLGNTALADKIANDASELLHQIELDKIALIEREAKNN